MVVMVNAWLGTTTCLVGKVCVHVFIVLIELFFQWEKQPVLPPSVTLVTQSTNSTILIRTAGGIFKICLPDNAFSLRGVFQFRVINVHLHTCLYIAHDESSVFHLLERTILPHLYKD